MLKSIFLALFQKIRGLKKVGMKVALIGLVVLLGFPGIGFGQNSSIKELSAFRTSDPIVIDGVLDETVWELAEPAVDFVQQDPYPGADASLSTEVRVLYTDDALYIGARMHDPEPDRILRELSERNTIGNADHFEVIIDPYRDGLNGYSFVLTASGVQRDARMYSNTTDPAWDAVWESAVVIDSLGWVVEMKIPYSAIRFSARNIQDWSINFGRNIRRTREQSWWNEIDPNIDGVLQQSGILRGLVDLEPPLRLSLYPFFSINKDYNDITGRNPWGVSGGMDLKYGFSQAFTLDMTLVPDFSQAVSDKDELNLSPFELVFDENRQFFTEGMEIFNRGDLFYSRRIGGQPSYFLPVEEEMKEGEQIIETPTTAQLINATKLSGRTGGGLGLGFFNAVSAREHTRVRDEDGNDRKIRALPLTNYNVVVADQSLRNNSSIAFMNTNVWREGSAPYSNASGTDFRFFTPDRNYVARGYGHISVNQNPEGSNLTGHQYHLELARVSGRIRGGIRYREISDGFDPNDLGLLLVNNERRFYGRIGYYRFEPIGSVNRFNSNLQLRYAQLYSSSDRTGLNLSWDASVFFRTWDALFFNIDYRPGAVKDFFEPRTGDFSRFYLRPTRRYGRFHYSSDYRRTIAANITLEGTNYPGLDRYIYSWTIAPRIRFSDRLFVIASTRLTEFKNDEGFINPNPQSAGFEEIGEGDIVFGSRDRWILENNLDLRFVFSNRMSAQFRARHFYSQVDYHNFYRLRENGELQAIDYTGKADGSEDRTLHDLTFHLFNIDLIYTWRFAPGSDLIFVWKNDISSSRNEDAAGYFREFRDLWNGPQLNSFTMKVIYYLDYHSYFNRS